jgi:hypothetical protein
LKRSKIMKGKTLILIVLAALAAGAAEHGRGEERVRIGMMMSYPGEMTGRVKAAFQRETEKALGLLDVGLVWRELGRSGGEEVYERVVVVRFRTGCKADEKGTALGLAHVSNGRVLPFVELDCGRVSAMMAWGGGGLKPHGAEDAYGRALARVAAHELHHVLTCSQTHDEEGLTKATFSREDLWGKEFAFSKAALERMRQSLGLQERSRGEQRASTEE